MAIKESEETEGPVTVSLTRELVGNMGDIKEQLTPGKFVFQVSVRRPAPHQEHQGNAILEVNNSGDPIELQIQKLAFTLATHLCQKYGDELDPDECAKYAHRAFIGLCKKLNEDGASPVRNAETI